MEPVTVSLTEDQIELIEELSGDGGPCTNRSEAMRMIIDQYTETKALKEENERLHRERRQLLEQREEHTELVSAVKEERSLAQRRANAGVLTRAKWWLVGMDDDETEIASE